MTAAICPSRTGNMGATQRLLRSRDACLTAEMAERLRHAHLEQSRIKVCRTGLLNLAVPQGRWEFKSPLLRQGNLWTLKRRKS